MIAFDGTWTALALEATLRITLLLLTALLVIALMRGASAAARHRVWLITLAGVIALPLLIVVLPGWHVLPLPHVMGERVPAGVVLATASDPVGMASGSEARATSAVAFGAASAATASIQERSRGQSFVLLLWILGMMGLGSRLLCGLARVRGLERRATDLTDPVWIHLTKSLCRRLEVPRPVRLMRDSGVRVPMTWGIRSPVILLPADADQWDTDRRRVVLAHELAHIRRWDALTQWAGHLAVVLFWFHPLVWMAAHRLRQEREKACDDAVLEIGTRPHVYADHLLGLARSLGSFPAPAAALAMARRSQFEGRLLAILDFPHRRRPVGRRAATLLCMLPVAALLPLAALSPLSEQAQDVYPPPPAQAAVDTEAGAFTRPPEPPLPSYGLSAEDRNHLHWSSAAGRVAEIHARGKVEFSPDGSVIRHISPGGYLRVETRGEAGSRTIEVRPRPDGELEYAYFVNGAPRPWHVDARVWLSGVTAYLARSSAEELHLLEEEARLGLLDR